MLTLRADPWMPEYGMGFDVRFDEPPAVVDPFVETHDWSLPRKVAAPRAEAVQFIDGVRRIDLRVIADVDGRRVSGLFGSYAVGSARCDSTAAFGEHQIGRYLVLGGGVRAERIDLPFRNTVLTIDPESTPGTEPDDPLLKLQALMRASEAELAARIAGAAQELVIVDGPLAFFGDTRAAVVGAVKRFGRVYLNPSEGQLIPRLSPGERTPLFAIGGVDDRRRRYAWYARLSPVAIPWHDHAGVIRCEVRGGATVASASPIADRVTALLPRFAGRAADPRTPQNLVPVAGLETWLRHRAGDTRLIRRALLDWIATEARAA